MRAAAFAVTTSEPRKTAATLATSAAVVAIALVAAAAEHAGVDALRVAVLLAIAPIAEEALLRAGLQEALLRHGTTPRIAVVAAAIAFGSAHALVHRDASALAVALPALAIGVVYQRTRRLRHCVLLHAAMNAVWLAGGLGATLPLFAR